MTRSRPDLIETIKYRNAKGIWYVRLAVVMPDHVHVVVWFPEIDKARADDRQQMEGMDCQNFEDRLGSAISSNIVCERKRAFARKLIISLANPVRAGLVERVEDWPYVFIAEPWKGRRAAPTDAAARRPYLVALSNSSTSALAS